MVDEHPHWLIFNPLLDDETLRAIMYPLIPTTIDREGNSGRADYAGNQIDIYAFREKEKKWLAKWHEENDERLEAERETRFQKYYASLDLDHLIEIVSILSHADGRKEESTYQMKIAAR